MKLVIAALLGACGSFEPPPPTAVVTLRDPGAEPRRALAYRPRASVPAPRFSYVIENGKSLELALAWQLDPKSTPHTSRYRFSVTDAKMPGAPAAEPALDAFTSLDPGAVVSDDHGRASAAVPGSRTTWPSIPALLTTFIVPLPIEPVGVGARWHVDSKPTEPPNAQSTDYQLTALTADGAEVAWDTKATSSVDGSSATLHATATIRFDDLLAVAGQAKSSVRDPRCGGNATGHIQRVALTTARSRPARRHRVRCSCADARRERSVRRAAECAESERCTPSRSHRTQETPRAASARAAGP